MRWTVSTVSDKMAVSSTTSISWMCFCRRWPHSIPQQIAILQKHAQMMFTMHSTMSGMLRSGGRDERKCLARWAQAFDAAKNDDSFYLPPEVFDNADFKRAMDSFLSPDGKSARFIISHQGDPATTEGIARIEQIRTAAEEALKGTPLVNAKVYLAGAASTAKDWHDGSTYDLWIAGVAALCLVFIIMLIITRSLIAALVIVGTVALSLGASFGLSVLLWQYILGIQLHWMVLAMSVIILLAVGSDYNLLLVSRMKEEVGAGINTGIYPRDGWHRQGRHDGRTGVRRDDGVDGGQRPADHRSDRYHHRLGPAVRHHDRALVHDAVDRGSAGSLVLVAAAGAPAPRQFPSAALWDAPTGTRAAGRCPRSPPTKPLRHRSCPGRFRDVRSAGGEGRLPAASVAKPGRSACSSRHTGPSPVFEVANPVAQTPRTRHRPWYHTSQDRCWTPSQTLSSRRFAVLSVDSVVDAGGHHLLENWQRLSCSGVVLDPVE